MLSRQSITNRLVRQFARSEGSVRSSGGSWAKKEQAQEDLWAHNRDLELYKNLQQKLKHAQEELEQHTLKMISKNNNNSSNKKGGASGGGSEGSGSGSGSGGFQAE